MSARWKYWTLEFMFPLPERNGFEFFPLSVLAQLKWRTPGSPLRFKGRIGWKAE